MGRRGTSGRFPLAVAASAGLHALVLGLLWFSVSAAEPPPRPQVFKVDLVSPPPNVAGEPAPSPPATETAAPEPEPEAATPPPAPEPEPVVSEPEPSRAAEPSRQPEPKQPAPKQPEPKQPAPKQPAPKQPAAKQPEPKQPAPKQPTPKTEPPKSPSTTSGRPTERPREAAQKEAPRNTTNPPTRNPVPATGRNPDANSPGGEGLTVRTEGAEFVDPAYLANIIRQLKRYFRPPPGARTDEAEVRFWINRDGSVSEIAIGKSRGSFQFRAAAMEAVEQAGLNKAFGPLPAAYRGNRLPVSFTFEPES